MAGLPTYIYSDGTTITFKELGPKKAAIITYGETLTNSSGDIIFTKGNTLEGNYSFSGTIDDLVDEMIIPYNNSLTSYGKNPVSLLKTDPPIITNPSQPPISNDKGEILIDLPQYIPFTSNPEDVTVTIQKEGYQNYVINPYTLGGSLRSLPIIELIPNQIALDEEIAKTNELSSKQVDELLKSKKTPEWFAQQRISKITINKIQKKLIPLILTQIIGKFGASNPSDLIKKIQDIKSQGKDTAQQEIMDLIQQNLGSKSFCPSQETIREIIEIKNKTTSQLNQVMTLLNINTKILGVNVNLIDASAILLQVLRFSPIPIPPGAPVSLVGLIEDTKELVDKDLIKKLGDVTSGTLAILLIARQILTQVLNLMSLLDELIQFCSPDEVEYDQELSQDLLDLSNQQTTENLNPPLSRVNGFKIEIEKETTKKPLKRKRAIARDTNGVVVLKGEYSYSSIDQILIDELVFYIQQNNLKSE